MSSPRSKRMASIRGSARFKDQKAGNSKLANHLTGQLQCENRQELDDSEATSLDRHIDDQSYQYRLSPAKINLSLRILGKRDDGFHELETVMVPVSLFDRIGVRRRHDHRIKLSVTSVVDTSSNIDEDLIKKIPTGRENLVVQVAEAFQQAVGTEIGADIKLKKVIPAGGGLAGASTNAATTLQILNQLWEARWGNAELAKFAAKFGSDIPFFFSNSAAVCAGRGEIITPTPCDSSVWIVVVRPEFGLATPLVFQELNAPRLAPQENQWSRMIQQVGSPLPTFLSQIAIGRWSQVGTCLKNDLKPPAIRIRPELIRLENCLRKTKPIGYQMSGSGSCFFAVYRNRREANVSAKHLRNNSVGMTYVVRPTARTLIA